MEKTEELIYSKKQINPIITKYKIDVEKNTNFKEIILMFPNQTNYQVWGLKCVFNFYCKLDTIKYIKSWADNNHQLIQKLSKGNIISYTSEKQIKELLEEIESLNCFAVVKRNIEKYNTDQRKIWASYIGITDTVENIKNNSKLKELHPLFADFEKLSDYKQNNFLTKCSSVRDAERLVELLKQCLANPWDWNKEELLNFVRDFTPTSKVIYDCGDIVVVQINDFEASAKTCGGDKTTWCITTNKAQFNDYVTNNNRKQYFMFNFSKQENDELAKIGITVSGEGIYAAHSTHNSSLVKWNNFTYEGKKLDIGQIIDMFKVPMKVFMNINKDNMKIVWSKEGVLSIIENNSQSSKVYENGDILIVKTTNEDVLSKLLSHTFVSYKKFQLESNETRGYVLFDFSKNFDDTHSLISILVKMDEYGTESIIEMYDIFGVTVNKDDTLGKYGIKDKDILEDISLDPKVLIQKHIDENNEEEAIKVLMENPDMDINYNFNGRITIYSAIMGKMTKLVKLILESKNFDPSVKDMIEENCVQEILCCYVFSENESTEKEYDEMLRAVLDSNKFDLNEPDITGETPLILTTYTSKLNWVARELIENPNINVNAVNEDGQSALQTAIINNNIEFIKMIGEREDLIIREEDKETAMNEGIELDKLIKPKKKAKKETLSEDEKEMIKKINKYLVD